MKLTEDFGQLGACVNSGFDSEVLGNVVAKVERYRV